MGYFTDGGAASLFSRPTISRRRTASESRASSLTSISGGKGPLSPVSVTAFSGAPCTTSSGTRCGLFSRMSAVTYRSPAIHSGEILTKKITGRSGLIVNFLLAVFSAKHDYGFVSTSRFYVKI